MNESTLSRRGVFSGYLGGWTFLSLCRRTALALPRAAVREPAGEPVEGASIYTFDEQARLFSVVTYDQGKITTFDF